MRGFLLNKIPEIYIYNNLLIRGLSISIKNIVSLTHLTHYSYTDH